MSRQYKPTAGFWVRLGICVLYPVSGMLFRLRFRGFERVPEHGGAILAINHVSYLDPVVMARFVWQAGRIPRFLIKSDLFSVPLVGRILTGARQIPVYRGTADAPESLRDAAHALDRGECVVIYPEGTITHDPDKWPMEGRTGIARLALLRPDVPVLPVGQWGAQQTFDSLTRRVRPFPRKPLTAQVGPPVDLSAFRDRPGDDAAGTAQTLRAVTDVVMAAIRAQVADIRGVEPPAEVFRLERIPGTRRPRRRPHLPRRAA